MATAAKACYWCLHLCQRPIPFVSPRRIAACAQYPNGVGERGTGTVQVELDRPRSRDLEKQLTDASLPTVSTNSVYAKEASPGWPLSELSRPPVLKAVAVEFMAQILFNFASCSAVATAGNLAGGSPALMTWQVMAFHSALLLVLVGATQPISGGHFNPMVSTMMAVWGELPWKRLPLYISAQVLGSAIGSAAQFYSLPTGMQDVAHAAVQAVPKDHSVAQAFMGETVAAFILMFVVCMVGLDKKGDPKKIPVVMALTIPALIYVVGPVSSMCINPARAFGPAMVSGFWDHHWLWWTAPFVGGLLAVLPYKYMTDLEDVDI